MTIVRAQQSIASPSSTRMYICVVDAAGLAIHVLALSAMEATHIGMLEWPTAASVGNQHPPLQCAHNLNVLYNDKTIRFVCELIIRWIGLDCIHRPRKSAFCMPGLLNCPLMRALTNAARRTCASRCTTTSLLCTASLCAPPPFTISPCRRLAPAHPSDPHSLRSTLPYGAPAQPPLQRRRPPAER